MGSNSISDFDQTKACNNCLFPEPFAHLNEDQICHECVNYRPPALRGIEALKREFENVKGEGKYDCIVGISGGRDSTYTLYVAKTQLNLKVLAFNYNNEFVHERAISNMKTVCKALGVDFVSVVSKRSICHKIVADQLRMASHFGPATVAAHLCGPCNVGGYFACRKLAMKQKVPIVLLGNSREELLPDYLHSKVGAHIPLKKKILNRKSPYFFRAHYYRLLQRLEFSAPCKEILNLGFKPRNEYPELQKARGVKVLSMFNYIRWDRREIVGTIEKEVGWKKADHQLSSIVPKFGWMYIFLNKKG